MLKDDEYEYCSDCGELLDDGGWCPVCDEDAGDEDEIDSMPDLPFIPDEDDGA